MMCPRPADSHLHLPPLQPPAAVKADRDYSLDELCDAFGAKWEVLEYLNKYWVSTDC